MTHDNNQPDQLLEQVENKVQNRFLLAVATAKRARQLKEGVKPLVEVDEEPLIPVRAALEEIAEEKIKVTIDEEVEEDQEMLEKMDQLLETELAAEEEEEKAAKEEKKKDSKSKSKSKSLAA